MSFSTIFSSNKKTLAAVTLCNNRQHNEPKFDSGTECFTFHFHNTLSLQSSPSVPPNCCEIGLGWSDNYRAAVTNLSRAVPHLLGPGTAPCLEVDAR